MRMYPNLPRPRARQIAADLSVVAFLCGCAILALIVRAAVLTMRVISDGVDSISTGIHGTWSSAADIFASVPLLGDRIAGLLGGLADGTVGNAADFARSISAAITLTANVLAMATFLVPLALVGVFWLPTRLRRAQRWDAAARVLGAAPVQVSGPPPVALELAGVESATLVVAAAPPPQLLAMRALCQLPLADLVRFEARPFEAYARGEYDRLVAALYDFEGLRQPG